MLWLGWAGVPRRNWMEPFTLDNSIDIVRDELLPPGETIDLSFSGDFWMEDCVVTPNLDKPNRCILSHKVGADSKSSLSRSLFWTGVTFAGQCQGHDVFSALVTVKHVTGKFTFALRAVCFYHCHRLHFTTRFAVINPDSIRFVLCSSYLSIPFKYVVSKGCLYPPAGWTWGSRAVALVLTSLSPAVMGAVLIMGISRYGFNLVYGRQGPIKSSQLRIFVIGRKTRFRSPISRPGPAGSKSCLGCPAEQSRTSITGVRIPAMFGDIALRVWFGSVSSPTAL